MINRILDLKESMHKTEEALKEEYDLIDITVNRRYISADTEYASMTCWTYDEESNVQHVCNPNNTPNTYEEFEEIKRNFEKDREKLLNLAEEFKRITDGRND